MINRIRYHFGRYLYYLGFRILPANMRRGLACMSSLGMTWAKRNPDQFQSVVDGKTLIEWEWKSAYPMEDGT